MALVVLIVAAREAEGSANTLAATLPLVGRTLIEQQARRAMAAGADELLLVADRLPADLLAAVERLRDAGLAVHPARGGVEAAGLVGPAADLVLIADGVLPDESALAALAGRPAPALLTSPDVAGTEPWERIDATTRWAGVARLSWDDLLQTATMVGDWDLELTLVRNLVGRAARVEAPVGSVIMVRDTATAATIGAELAARIDANGPAAPIAQGLLGWVTARHVEAMWLRAGAVGAAAAGALLAAGGPLWLAVPPLLAAGPLDRLGRRLAVLRREREALGPGWVRLRLVALGLALPLFGWRLSGAGGFEPLLLALVALAFLVAARGEARLHDLSPERWSARPEPLLWLAALAATAGQGRAGLGALALWSAASFFRLQRRALRSAAQRFSTGT